MDERIERFTRLTRAKFGFANYQLKDYKLLRRKSGLGKTVYLLHMEWIPTDCTNLEEVDCLPEGAATIELDVHTGRFETIIFVGGKTMANGVEFRPGNVDSVIRWVELETGLMYGDQFRLVKQTAGKFLFRVCVSGIIVSPGCTIRVKHDGEGRLILFSLSDELPSKEKVREEPYRLSLDQVERWAKGQIKLMEVPAEQEKKFVPVYGIEEIFVTNDLSATIPFEIFTDKRRVSVKRKLCWDSPIRAPFEQVNINLGEQEQITAEQAFAMEPHPDTFPITGAEQEEAIQAVVFFLRQVFPEESGQWIFHTLHRDKGYLLATLKRSLQDNRLFQRKLVVMLDAGSLRVLNYMDNRRLLEAYRDFTDAAGAVVDKDFAFEKIKPFLEITPAYVYDFDGDTYRLCGKIDCPYGVHGVGGQVILLSDL